MSKDPFQYFRIEARELLDGITRGVLELESGAGGQDRVADLLRLAHTLKGAARVVKQPAIAELAHAIEGVLVPFRSASDSVSPDGIAELLRLVDGIGVHLAVLDPAPGPNPAKSARSVSEEDSETVRVEVEEVQAVLECLTAGSTHLAAMRQQFQLLEQVRRLVRAAAPNAVQEVLQGLDRLQRGWMASLDQAERELTQARERAEYLQLQSVAVLFPPLARAARDAAHALGKQVEVDSSGGELRLDAHVLALVRDALLHLVNNAVAHGIEEPGVRVAAGKPVVGRIELRVERRGGQVLFLCRDDGGGIDVEAIRRVAVQRGAISPAQAGSLELNQAIALLLHGGISTTPILTEVAGRGIGLDIVRAAVARLRGEITIESAFQRGATIQIRVPVSLASVPALMVEAEGAEVAIPLDAVRQSLLLADRDLVGAGANLAIAHEGRMVPFSPLSRVLGHPLSGEERRPRWSAVLIAAGSRSAALGVDRLHGIETVLVQRLPEEAAADALVAGASLDGEGNPRLVLDPLGLVDAIHHPVKSVPVVAPERVPILVVDDSLTTRMLEQSILESAGYLVELAISAEDAWDKAIARRYCLFLVDVEMPGMDGFAFVTKTRAHPDLRNVPAILITSRNSSEDRRRGERAGAAAYMVKSEFDQVFLLQTVHRLVNQS